MGSRNDMLLKMLAGKKEINICIYIENGAETNERPLSKVTVRVKDDLLIFNDMIPIPCDDRYIARLDDSEAEIVFIDPDSQVVHVKICI
jgi:hypothetical protein